MHTLLWEIAACRRPLFIQSNGLKKTLKYWQAVSQQISPMKCRWNIKWVGEEENEGQIIPSERKIWFYMLWERRREMEGKKMYICVYIVVAHPDKEFLSERDENKKKRVNKGRIKVKSLRVIGLEITERVPSTPLLLILCNYFYNSLWHI